MSSIRSQRSVRFSEPGDDAAASTPTTSAGDPAANKAKRVHPMRRKHKLQGIDDLPPKKRKRQQQQQPVAAVSVPASDLPFAQFDDEDGQDWSDDAEGESLDGDAAASGSVKRTKLGDLDWRSIETPSSVSLLDGEGGMLVLEEVDDVDVQWELDGKGGKKAVLTKVPRRAAGSVGGKKGKKKKEEQGRKEAQKEDDVDMSDTEAVSGVAMPAHEPDVAFDGMSTLQGKKRLSARIPLILRVLDSLLPNWADFALHPLIKRGLAKLGFTDPTEIQKQAIPVALQAGKDVVGVAETVSYREHVGAHVLTLLRPRARVKRSPTPFPSFTTSYPHRSATLSPPSFSVRPESWPSKSPSISAP